MNPPGIEHAVNGRFALQLARTGYRAAFLTVMCLAMGAWAVGLPACRSCSGEGKVSRGETRALGEAVMMLHLAGEDVIRDSAQEVDPRTLAADVAPYVGKWIAVEGSVSWLQSRAGERIELEQGKEETEFYYWLEGPVAVLDTSESPAQVGAGGAIRAYGRCLEVDVAGLALKPSGEGSLRAMDGGDADKVVLLLAKWVEVR